jgi:predicted nucleotidyltransferase
MSSDDLFAVALSEAERILKQTAGDSSCIMTGSIVEGFGNIHSDIDLYVITGDESAGQITAMGLRKARYIDCEFMKLASLSSLRRRIAYCDWRSIGSIKLREIDRYYRVAIGTPVYLSVAAEATVSQFSKPVACQALAKYSTLAAYEHLARAACAIARGAEVEATLLAREAARWDATRRMAEVGGGYAALKWVGEKAARHYGRGSKEFTDLVEAFMRPTGDLRSRVDGLRQCVIIPGELRDLLESRECELAPEVNLVAVDRETYLIRARSVVAPVSSLVAATCRELASGRRWADATAAVAASAGLAAAEFRVALWHMTRELRTNGFLRPSTTSDGGVI